MGEKLTKAILEQEEQVYLGIPDESVNLSFEDLAEVTQNPKTNININTLLEWEKVITIETNSGVSGFDHKSKRLPSFEFSKALQPSSPNYNIHQHHPFTSTNLQHHPFTSTNLQHHHHYHIGHQGHNSHNGHHVQGHNGLDHLTMSHDHHHHIGHHLQGHNGHDHLTMPHDHHQQHHGVQNISNISMASMYQERTGIKRRAGIPHSNICTICSNYVYLFQHRCLVCGRVYCRSCVSKGMGKMVEGRKCTECLGRRFSQRYIERAGEVGCCFSRYPFAVRQAELKWAEMGARRSGERAYIRSGMMSTSRSPISPKSPTIAHSSSNPNSFVMSSSYSPYTPIHHHHLPF